MKINRNSWHAKVYFWFTESSRSQVNLCPYVRAVFVWAPLAWLFIRGWIWRVPMAAVSWTALWGGIHATLWHFWPRQTLIAIAVQGLAVVTIAVIIGAGYLAYLWHEKRTADREAWLRSQMTEEEYRDYKWLQRLPARLRKPAKPPSLTKRAIVGALDAIGSGIELLMAYASAVHNKICPLIEIK